MTTSITPLILGRGMAGQAMAKSLSMLRLQFDLQEHRFLERGPLKNASDYGPNPLLLIANPHGLHAKTLLEAEARGFQWIVVDKPICTTSDDLAALSKLKANTWVCHGYRQAWGPQKLRELCTRSDFGKIISIEGRYWQSSAAQKAVSVDAPSASVSSAEPKKSSWKNNTDLGGHFDVALDLATHWMDLVHFLSGSVPTSVRGWKSYVNAEAPHRDTHVHLAMSFANGLRSLGSISKTVHGRGNHLEVHVLGEKAAASWNIECPDEVIWARGAERQILLRTSNDSLGLYPFHGAGWVGGYASVIQTAVLRMLGQEAPRAPTLSESLELMRTFFRIEWENGA